jgi:hypothetical protein
MICYKVVAQETDGPLTSIFSANPFHVRYKEGEYVGSHLNEYGYGLCAFTNLAEAQIYQVSMQWLLDMQTIRKQLLLYMAEGNNQIPLPPFLINIKTCTLADISYAHQYPHHENDMSYLLKSWPKGTVMFEQIKLLVRMVIRDAI